MPNKVSLTDVKYRQRGERSMLFFKEILLTLQLGWGHNNPDLKNTMTKKF